MKHPNPLMLVRIAQGDAYGMACEYLKFPRDEVFRHRALQFEHYCRHPTHKLEPGQYTDDTQMSVAVAEVLLADHDLNPFSRLKVDKKFGQNGNPIGDLTLDLKSRFAESFVRCFKRDQRDGYARGFQALLEEVRNGAELLQKINPESDKNGAAMRSVPLGVLPTPNAVIFVAETQAQITHHTPGGIESSVLVALMSYYALHESERLDRFRDWVDQFVIGMNFDPWDGSPVTGPGVGMNTARAVLTLLETESTLIGIARKALQWGGDTDSVLAIAWGIASARMNEKLPPFFDGGLENGTYGRRFLADLGEKLMAKYADS